jgi:hypothetical protein
MLSVLQKHAHGEQDEGSSAIPLILLNTTFSQKPSFNQGSDPFKNKIRGVSGLGT